MSVDFWLWLLNKSLCLLKWTCEERFKNVQLKCNLTLSQPNKTSKFTWKHLCWGLFLIMLQAYSKCRPTATVNNCLWNENYFKKWICETNLHTCSWPRNLLPRYSQGLQELLWLIFLECEFISRQYGYELWDRRRTKTVCLAYAKEVLNLIRSILPKDVKGKIWKMQKTYH